MVRYLGSLAHPMATSLMTLKMEIQLSWKLRPVIIPRGTIAKRENNIIVENIRKPF